MRQKKIPLVSFVVPAYNEKDYLSDCLRSLKAQRTNATYEIIVVDNNSSDGTGELARRMGAKVVLEKKKGLAFARQKGLEVAKGDYLIYVDADTRLPNDFITNCLRYFHDHKEVVGFSPRLKYFDGGIKEHIFIFFAVWFVVVPLNFFLRLSNKPATLLGNASICVRRRALLQAGGIDLNFPFHGEDTSLAYRLHSQGEVRFVLSMETVTSSRRLLRKGYRRTLYQYVKTYLLISSGKYEQAKSFASMQNRIS
jgi:glycosyltransferase involved in cell wall biosynthesis